MHEVSSLKEKSIPELKALDVELSKALYRMKNEWKIAKKLEKPHLLKGLKKDRARVLTIISEKTAANS
ncbi:MAG: 50S ribosomal protein L29 [Chlamydiae bacterium]|nr:50S ribosomal protein L29 [Chlamydiota bacterium]